MSGDIVFLPLHIPEIDTYRRKARDADGEHRCYFCQPATFPPMPKHCTLCCRCGVFMYTGIDDPTNEGMECCWPCQYEMSDQ